MQHLVFVYGSLKTGFYNHYCLDTAKFIDTGMTPQGNVMYDLGAYPGIVKDPTAGCVTGEVFMVDDAGMRSLDRLESNGSLYQRELVPIETSQGIMECWVYYYLCLYPEYAERIPDGTWKQAA